MHVKNRFWFIRFLEGTDGGNAGGNQTKSPEGKQPPAGDHEEIDWEAKAKELEADRDRWKGHARTWEDRAKSDDDAGKSDMQKLQEEMKELKETAAQREAELAKKERKALIALIAAEEGVAKADTEFLPDSDDEDAVRKIAKRLATSSGQGAESNNFGGATGSSKESVINRVKNL